MDCRVWANLGKCIVNDRVNLFVEFMKSCDGLIIASPVHYASLSGATVVFLDRVFFSAFVSGQSEIFYFYLKNFYFV